MYTYRFLMASVLCSCVLVACSSASEPEQEAVVAPKPKPSANSSERLSHQTQSPVIVDAAEVAALTPMAEEEDVGAVQQLIVNLGEPDSRRQSIRKVLSLKPNQILVFGTHQSKPQYLLSEFAGNSLFATANDLIINRMRTLKTEHHLSKDAFESTAQYQQRVEQRLQRLQELTSQMPIDLEQLEAALNILAHPLMFSTSKSDDEKDGFYYDAENQTLYLTASYIREPSSRSKHNKVHQFSIVTSIASNEARDIYDAFISTGQGKLGLVFNYHNQQLSLDRIIYPASYSVVYQFKPDVVTVKQFETIDGELVAGTMQQHRIPLHQAFPFKFGLSSYYSKAKQPPTLPEANLEPSEPEEGVY
ncbi:hypothetical protein [Acinetobacter sp. 3657]|uniref:hypothetical protein n=1 Tax=Acinetobacter sp. 3657 TaxID=2817764 RepID=UPI002854459E|nr:hypothetical protein [Prolinoborus sp. 3657]